MKKKGNLCFNEAADCGILIEEGGISGVLRYRANCRWRRASGIFALIIALYKYAF